MRSLVATAVLVGCSIGCASLTPEGSRVKVYEADLGTPPESRRLPDGCRLLAATPPVDQMESERHGDDPYRAQRNDTGGKGGNVLLVLSDRFVTRYKTDCAPSDTSADCQNRQQNWYKVSFQSYACDPAALDALAQIPGQGPGPIASWWPFGKKASPSPAPAAAPTPATAAASSAAPPAPVTPSSTAPPAAGLAPEELKAKVLVLVREGVGTDVIVAYVKSHPLRASLTAEEILNWKRSGIAEPVIEAALSGAPAVR